MTFLTSKNNGKGFITWKHRPRRQSVFTAANERWDHVQSRTDTDCVDDNLNNCSWSYNFTYQLTPFIHALQGNVTSHVHWPTDNRNEEIATLASELEWPSLLKECIDIQKALDTKCRPKTPNCVLSLTKLVSRIARFIAPPPHSITCSSLNTTFLISILSHFQLIPRRIFISTPCASGSSSSSGPNILSHQDHLAASNFQPRCRASWKFRVSFRHSKLYTLGGWFSEFT